MALIDKSLFLYGLEVTPQNNALDFRTVALETPRQATIPLGFYSLTGLMNQIALQLKAHAPLANFTVTADRSISGGTQNRVTISTTSGFFQLLFGTGPRAASTIAPLIGFTSSDQSGFTSYTGTSTSGTALQTFWTGEKYVSPDQNPKVFGSVNVSASGVKEAIVFQIQHFIEVQFRYEPQSKIVPEWKPFMNWAIQQRGFEFTPEIVNYNTVYDVTLESSPGDSKGLGFMMVEMIPQFPFRYDTGKLKFRLTET